MTTPSPEAIEAVVANRYGYTSKEQAEWFVKHHPTDVALIRADLAAAYAVDMPTALKNAAKDVYLWAHAMTTQQAMTAATFAADRILELAGIDGDEADEVAREAHAEWTARIARQEKS